MEEQNILHEILPVADQRLTGWVSIYLFSNGIRRGKHSQHLFPLKTIKIYTNEVKEYSTLTWLTNIENKDIIVQTK